MARLHTFAANDDLTGLDASFWAKLLERTMGRPQSVSSPFASWPGNGGLYRLGVVTGLERGETVTLDDEADWRDRLHVTVALRSQPTEWVASYTGPAHPGSPNDKLTRPAFALSAISSGYTGDGRVSPATHGYVSKPGDVYSMWADRTTGALKLYRDSGDSAADPDTAYILVMASEQTGQRSSPAAHPSLDVLDGTPIEPHVLNGFQDRALLGQVREAAGSIVDSFPLGPKLDAGGIPEIWTVRGSRQRQPVAGMTFRYFAAARGDLTEDVLDDSIDWRDRLVWISGRRSSAAAIFAGGSGEASHNAATGFNTARYTGPGEDGALVLQGYSLQLDQVWSSADLQLRVRPSDGALTIANETGATQYVTGIIGATFQLGPRSS